MIVALVDTNVLLSGIVGYDKPLSPPRIIIDRWLNGDFSLVVSPHIMREVEVGLTQSYFMKGLSRQQQEDSLDTFRILATWTYPTNIMSGVAPHASDDHLFAAALSGGVHYIVTGDQQIQAKGS